MRDTQTHSLIIIEEKEEKEIKKNSFKDVNKIKDIFAEVRGYINGSENVLCMWKPILILKRFQNALTEKYRYYIFNKYLQHHYQTQ